MKTRLVLVFSFYRILHFAMCLRVVINMIVINQKDQFAFLRYMDLIDHYFLDSLLITNKRTEQENEMCSLKEKNGEYYTLFQDLLDQLSKFALVK